MRRDKSAGLGITLLVAALVAGLTMVAPAQPAEATCNGEGSPATWTVGWADETVQTLGTCDGLGDYYGKVADGAEDGNCVDLYRKDDIGSSWVFTKRSCTLNVWVNFNYSYADEDAYFRTCKHISGVCSSQRHNWGF